MAFPVTRMKKQNCQVQEILTKPITTIKEETKEEMVVSDSPNSPKITNMTSNKFKHTKKRKKCFNDLFSQEEGFGKVKLVSPIKANILRVKSLISKKKKCKSSTKKCDSVYNPKKSRGMPNIKSITKASRDNKKFKWHKQRN